MASSTTEIANLAIAHLGISKPIGNLDTEQSMAAQAGRLYYQPALLKCFRDAPWMFCKKFATMQLVTDFTIQSPASIVEWSYAYRYPSDCLHFIRIISAQLNNDTRQSRVPYTIGADDSGLLIYSDWPAAGSLISPQCEYRFNNQNVGVYPSDFVMAFSYLLAKYMAPMLTAGDPYQLGVKCFAQYKLELEQAASLDLNEEQRPEDPESEFVRARDNSDPALSGSGWDPTGGGFTVQ